MIETYSLDDILIHADKKKNHKYIARVPTGDRENPYRYFYTMAEYQAYQKNHSGVLDAVNNSINSIKNSVHEFQDIHDAFSSKDEEKALQDTYDKNFGGDASTPDDINNESMNRSAQLDALKPKGHQYEYDYNTGEYEHDESMTPSEWTKEKKKVNSVDNAYKKYKKSKNFFQKIKDFNSAVKKYK